MKLFCQISVPDAMLRLVRQTGAEIAHFNVWQNDRDAGACAPCGQCRAYALKGDPLRRIWLNGEHVASFVRWES